MFNKVKQFFKNIKTRFEKRKELERTLELSIYNCRQAEEHLATALYQYYHFTEELNFEQVAFWREQVEDYKERVQMYHEQIQECREQLREL